MVQKGKATTIYAPPDLMVQFRKICKEKLGKKAGPRIIELIKKDIGELTGKPIITVEEDISDLQSRLEALSRSRTNLMRDLTAKGVYNKLHDALEDLSCNFKTLEASKASIRKLQKAYSEDKINVDAGDFQLFIGLCEISTERFQVIDRIAVLRAKRYSKSESAPPSSLTSEEAADSEQPQEAEA